MANLKFYTTISSRLSDIPVVDGQLIFVNDVGVIYLDFNGIRVPYNLIKTLATENERQQLSNPEEGWYFVEETCVLWKYSQKWYQVTSSNNDNIIFAGNYDDLPPKGKENILYVTEDANYIWRDSLNDYLMTANKTEWKGI